MSIVTTITTTATVIQSIVGIAQNGELIVNFVEKAVKQVEEEADANIVSSDSKLQVVLEYVKAFIDVVGESWDSLKNMVTSLVNSIVETYNEIGLFTHGSTSDAE